MASIPPVHPEPCESISRDGRGFGTGLFVGIAATCAVSLAVFEYDAKPAIYRQIADGELVIETHTWPDGTRDVRAIRK